MEKIHRNGIMIAGTVIVDKINEIPAYPQCGELTQIQNIRTAVGGCVPNVALDIKRVCPELAVYAAGTIGDDAEGDFVTAALREGGIDITGLTVLPSEKTSFTEVMSVPGAQRTFFTYAGASAQFSSEHLRFSEQYPRLLHLGYFLVLKKVDEGEGLRILKTAQSCGIETSIDLVSENSQRYALVVPCLPYTDYLIINELEAGRLTGVEPTYENLRTIAQMLMDKGVRKKVILHMPECAVCLSAEGWTCVPSLNLPDGYIQGTRGAGDAFCAGALIGIYNKLPDREILELASECAAMTLGCPDATSGMCDYARMRAFCSQFKRKCL